MSEILTGSLERSIRNRLGEARVRNQLMKTIDSFIDKNVEVLQDSAPQYRLFFNDSRDRDPIYRLFDVSEKDINDLVAKIPSLNKEWKVATKPFHILMSLIIRELTFNPDKLYKILLERCRLYLALSIYSSKQYKYFRVPPNEDVIAYTINNASNKFLFKSYGSVLKALDHTARVNHETYYHKLVLRDDKNILDYFVNLDNRINGLIQNFKNEYEKNLKEKRYLGHETDNTDDEGYKETTNVSMNIENIVNKLTLKFFTASIDERIVKMSAKSNSIDYQSLLHALGSIKDKESHKVSVLISYILEVYLTECEGTISSIKSKKFIVDGIGIYARSNTKDERILKSKEILEEFLTAYCKKYVESDGVVTKNRYKKALFSYFIFFISGNA